MRADLGLSRLDAAQYRSYQALAPPNAKHRAIPIKNPPRSEKLREPATRTI